MYRVLSARAEREGKDMSYGMGRPPLGSACGARRADVVQRHLRRRGVALVWSALMMMLIIGFVGLSIDFAKLFYNVHQMQNAADAAALGGAQVVKGNPPDVTRQRTHDIGFDNAAEGLAVTLRMTEQPDPFPYPTDWDNPAQVAAYEAALAPLDIVVGRWVTYNHTFVPTLDAPNAVMAITRRNTDLGEDAPALAMIFGPIFGVDTANASRAAVAFNASSGGAGLIVLSDLPEQGAEIGATADIIIDGGGIHVNSTSMGGNNSAGAWIHGSPVFDASFFNVVGTVSPPPDDSSWEDIFADAQAAGEMGAYPVMDYTDNVQHIDDPLAAAMIDAGEPYVDLTDPYYAGMRLRLPTLLESEIPTWYAGWNSSSSGYDLVDDPDNPSVYMQWNGSSYDAVAVDPAFDSNLFRDTPVGQVTQRVEVAVTDEFGNPVIDAGTGLPLTNVTYSVGNLDVTAELPPGYYPNGMTIQNGDAITLEPELGASGTRADKLFLFGGGTTAPNNNRGLYMTGGSLTGEGVTCYVTETFDNNGLPLGVAGVTKITGGALNVISPGDWTNQQAKLIDPDAVPDMSLVEGLNGISIWQDPYPYGDVAPPEAHLNGNGDFSISGTIYFPDPIHLRLEGDLGDTGNQVLCGTASILGTAEISVNYDGRNFGKSKVHCYLVR